MRLLKFGSHEGLSLTKNVIEDVPSYAILSHTWGADDDEVTFDDLQNGSGRVKGGRTKIQFCAEQAQKDGLQYCWVDTCCIDKANHTELAEAIASMFSWYRDAQKCYVYLSDVAERTWESDFRKSRWFTRGWTLQELLAPKSVEFFSQEGVWLGDRNTLEREIHETTEIPIMALRGVPLPNFSIQERMRWAAKRKTKRKEDKAYCLLGIFNVFMSPIYGEGENAFLRLKDKIDRLSGKNQNEQLLRTISHVGDAAYTSYQNQRHRPCLSETRTALLKDITTWATSNSNQYIYWLKGRAGTGKSTIALTIAQLLHQRRTILASFFFKRGGGDLARSRKMVSTIAFQLAFQSSLLGRFICDALREDPHLGDSASLSEQYHKLLLHPLQKIQKSAPGSCSFVAVLDALDECDDVDDVQLFLRLLGNTRTMMDLGLRLLVTSRPETPIRLGFHQMKHIAYHELALHDLPRAIVDGDIKTFVAHELGLIRAERRLPDSWPGNDKIQIVTTRADGLFIYAATVCRFVNGPRQIQASDRLEQVCQGSGAKHKSTDALDKMYLMVLDSSMNDDFSADEAQAVATRLRHLLGSLVLLLDNLSAQELERLLFPSMSTGGTIVQDTLDSLHAIFDVPEDPSMPVRMQHLSFRDFLVNSDRCPDPRFHINQRDGHRNLSTHCLDLMSRSLRRNICRLPGPGTLVSEVSEATLNQHVPFGLRYACRHWIDHTEHGRVSLDDDSRVYDFLLQYLPYWLEVVSLIGKIPEAMGTMRKLENLVEVSAMI